MTNPSSADAASNISEPKTIAGLSRNLAASFAVSLAIIVWALLAPNDWFVASSRFHFLFFLLALALAFPHAIGLRIFAIGVAANFALQYISSTKASLTNLPLTSLDLQIFSHNPAGFLGAMKWPPAIFFSITGGLALAIIVTMAWLARSHIRNHGTPGWRSISACAAACLLVAISLPVFSDRLFETVKPPSKYMAHAWEPPNVIKASNDLGVFPFLMFTARVDASGEGNRFYASTGGQAIAAESSEPYAAKFLHPIKKPVLSPNIALVLLESTFDIAKTFKLEPRPQTTLRVDYPGAALTGALDVNAIGGGTWISEFEVMTGIDSRLFGFAGYYTHVSVAPMIKSSLATHLKARGYDVQALYATQGHFYSGRKGFANYGVTKFLDSDHFGIRNPWHTGDLETIANYIRVLKPVAGKPFFAFLQTLGNHAPHTCKSMGPGPLPHRLKNETNREMNCQVNDYIRRQKFTEEALEKLEAHLKNIEAKTGRPYVMAIFGDHLPHTFVGTQSAVMLSSHNYDHLRQNDKTQTIYQIRSSLKSPFIKQRLDLPIAVLPTMISAYAAKDANDLYLPINLSIAYHCGGKLPINNSAGLFASSKAKANSASRECSKALDRAIPVYKHSTLK